MLIITNDMTVNIKRKDILDVYVSDEGTIHMLTKEDREHGQLIEIVAYETFNDSNEVDIEIQQRELGDIYNCIIDGLKVRNGVADLRKIDEIYSDNNHIWGSISINRKLEP